MYFPVLRCYNSKHLESNVWATFVSDNSNEWWITTLYFDALFTCVFVHADMSTTQLRGCITLFRISPHIGTFKNISFVFLVKECMMIQKYYQNEKVEIELQNVSYIMKQMSVWYLELFTSCISLWHCMFIFQQMHVNLTCIVKVLSPLHVTVQFAPSVRCRSHLSLSLKSSIAIWFINIYN
jgi:hypothetical protein